MERVDEKAGLDKRSEMVFFFLLTQYTQPDIKKVFFYWPNDIRKLNGFLTYPSSSLYGIDPLVCRSHAVDQVQGSTLLGAGIWGLVSCYGTGHH